MTKFASVKKREFEETVNFTTFARCLRLDFPHLSGILALLFETGKNEMTG